MSLLAPITLFTYNRPDHTRRTVDALAKNELAAESDLIIYSDGAKDDAGAAKVKAVRDYLHTVAGFKSITINEKEKNCGLANSVIAGVSEVVNKYGTVIVLEDDMVTSPYFLRYMNDALEMYRDEEQVISIHGYTYPVKKTLPETFFLPGADCWGWATWKRGWDLFEPDGRKLRDALQAGKLMHAFDFDGAFPFTKMLEDQISGKVDSWAVRWRASAFLHNKLTLYPGKSLLYNIGADSSGTHCFRQHVFDTEMSLCPVRLKKERIESSQAAFSAFDKYFRSIRIPLYKKILFKLNLIFRLTKNK